MTALENFIGTNLETASADPRNPLNGRERLVLTIIAIGLTFAFWVAANDEIARGMA